MVYMLLSRINERKGPGLDNIPNKLIKIAAEIISLSLTEIFARSISTGIFPSEWKMARVSPIFKKGIKNDPNNYRPISVIPAVAKFFENFIDTLLVDTLPVGIQVTTKYTYCPP
jgi:hypothetical protein